MRLAVSALFLVAAAVPIGVAMAFPDGAPWGAANPDAPDHCANCHFDSEPVRESAALTVSGLQAVMEPGTVYPLTVVLADPEAVVAGFQMIATAAGGTGGSFSSELATVETAGSAIRSTAPVTADGETGWALGWQPPDDADSPIVFYVAATAANHDGSPFGDRIHYRTYTVEIR